MIKMNCSRFDDNHVIRKETCYRVPFNSKIARPSNCEIAIMKDNVVRRLNRVENDILNPLGHFTFKRDPNVYDIYFIDTSFRDGNWGGNVKVYNPETKRTDDTLFVRLSFDFNVNRGDYLVDSLDGNHSNYTKRDLVNIVRKKINKEALKYIAKYVKKNSYDETIEDIKDLREDLIDYLNTNILMPSGLVISNPYLEIELESKTLDLPSEEDEEKTEKVNEVQKEN